MRSKEISKECYIQTRGLEMNLQYHKGQFCPYKPVFCQEGYCSECAIYCQNSLGGVLLHRDENMKMLEKMEGREALVPSKELSMVH